MVETETETITTSKYTHEELVTALSLSGEIFEIFTPTDKPKQLVIKTKTITE